MTLLHSIKERRFEPEVPLSDIEIDPLNVRTESVIAGLEELKASIKNVGLIHPVILIKNKTDSKYKLLVGQRRFRCFEQLGNSTIPAIVINDVDDITKRIISFSENLNRRQLPYNDTIKMCDELYRSYSHIPKSKRLDKISKEVGLSISTVVKYLSYRIIPDSVKNLVDEGKLDRSQAYRLTETFWPNTNKITKIATYMVGMTKPEWENLLEVGDELPPNSNIETIIEESKKPSRKITMKIRIEMDDFEKIKSITSRSETKVDVSEFISEIIKDYLTGQ